MNIKQDLALINQGTHFWCSGHLSAVPVSERSGDLRYCRACFDLLNGEAKLLRGRKPAWTPKAAASPPPAPQRHAEAPHSRDKVSVTVVDVETDMHKTQVILSHRGRSKKPLPEARIKELALQGKSSRDTARQLELEGISVSYRTVSRALAGKNSGIKEI